MKHLNEWNIFNKEKEGDALVLRLLDIVRDENIIIKHTGGFRFDIDGKIYSFNRAGSSCWVSKYDEKQEQNTAKYGNVILGEPESRYDISKKIWRKVEEMYNLQLTQKTNSDLEAISDLNRTSNKYNL